MSQRSFAATLTHPMIQGVLLLGGSLVLFAFFQLGSPTTDLKTESKVTLPNPDTIDSKVLLTKNSPDAYPGFTIAPTMETEEILLLNMDGQPVHSWPFDAVRARLLSNCNLLVIHGSKWGKNKKPWKNLRNVVREYDWNGKLVWQYEADDLVHHDTSRIEPGKTLVMKRMTVAAPLTPSQQGSLSHLQRPQIRSDVVMEVSDAGETLWEWRAHDHLDPNSCGWRECRGRQEERQFRPSAGITDWTHMNTARLIPENKWFDAGDERFKPGNLLVMARNLWTAYLVDRDTGEVVWQYEGDHNNGKDLEQGLIRGHEIHMIEKGLPGEGNLLVFDNGLKVVRPYSIVREVDPITKETVWRYEDKENFYSNASGSVQRLPSGNTLVSDDRGKRIFEVNRDKEIIWELKLGHYVARAHRYEQNHCPNLQDLPLRRNS